MPPIIACHPNSYGRFGALAAIEHVRAAGLDYIELPIRTPDVPSPAGDPSLITTNSTLSELVAVDQLLERNQVRVSSCTCLGGNPLDPQAVDAICRKLDLASHFGVRTVVTGAGSAEDGPERDALLANLQRIGDHAARLGMIACFDTQRGVCVNHREMLRLMRELEHPHLRINFDPGNLLFHNEGLYVETSLARICAYVKHLHLKDSMGRFHERYFPALGTGGAVDFVQVYQLMRGCGFRGPYSIEIEGIEGEPELTLAEHHQRVVQSVEYLRMIGYFD